MKKILSVFAVLFFLGNQISWACDVCEKNQPAGFENITHGAGPSGMLDYIIIWGGVVIVVATLIMSLKYLIRPKEGNPDHIKNIVRNEGF
ncbi:MAG: hypothetical protein ACTIJ9_15585 [Aequorivita sp.]